MTILIGYQNLFETGGTVSATSEAAGYPKENAYDWQTFDYWKASGTGTVYLTVDAGSAVPCDYWAVAAHDLGTNGASIQCQYSTDNATWSDAGAAVAPSTNKVIMRQFDAVTARYWRLKVVSVAAASSLGQVCIGGRLDLDAEVPVGFEPPHLSYDDRVLNAESEGGEFLGRTLYASGLEFPMTFDLLEADWIRTYWEPFVAHARLKPFFLSWDPDGHPDEAVLAWTVGKIAAPEYIGPRHMRASLRLRGRA